MICIILIALIGLAAIAVPIGLVCVLFREDDYTAERVKYEMENRQRGYNE